MAISMTVVIPAYNDAQGLDSMLSSLLACTESKGWEVIVVNDCSPDNTNEILGKFAGRIKVIENEVNLGYGGALKRGILAAETEWVATVDADGQHRISDLESLAGQAHGNVDAVIGVRDKDSHVTKSRVPGKLVLSKAANFITGRKIPDINCGLRVLRREVMLHIFSITSDKFSFSTSTLICLLALNCNVVYSRVVVDARIGTSAVKQVKDGLYTLMLMLRLITLFKPLRVFLPISLFLFSVGAINQLYVFVVHGLNFTTATVLSGIGGLIIFFMALIADQIAGLRRDILFQSFNIKRLSCNSTHNA
ncbi:glycosyltransferase family 2 protein [Maridesulfovibrio sp.]|uniref:glycosyltransferase family 2 protein n=1 Tax=Maridesulfovibrio sp. TaxID=2795000 RepID=UPI0029CA9ABE|nr:glycosyltransferase family 2 protein [Maridesulfovibrio sp.]